jgi:hypothetical protein
MILSKLQIIIVCISLLVLSSCYDKKVVHIPEPDITWMMNGPIESAVIWINEDEFMKLQAYIQATQDLQLKYVNNWSNPCQNSEKRR